MALKAINFVKMHGAGNDFVMIDDRKETFPLSDSKFIARLANRPDGMGSEGVIIVRNSQVADFKMCFFNPDGTEAEMCGNGARCVAAFALSIGAAAKPKMRFETRAGVVDAEVLTPTQVRIHLPDLKDRRHDFINSGVPHAIVSVDDLSAADVLGQGRRIRNAAEFAPAGTNVDFVHFEGPNRLAIRTYERGVEAETFACGTGAVAAAAIGVAEYGLKFPVMVRTVRGDELVIDGRFDGENFTGISLLGPVQVIYSGTYHLL